MAEYKIMPHNLEAEQAVLGCILIDGIVQTDILGMMHEEDFYSASHKDIYSTMLKIYQKSTPVDFITLTDQLDKDKILDKIKDDNLQSLFLEYDELLTEAIDIYSHDAYIEGVKFATNFLFNSFANQFAKILFNGVLDYKNDLVKTRFLSIIYRIIK